MNTILGTKKGMTQVFEDGVRIPVTRVVAGPCVVTQIKTTDRDGYTAIQLGFGTKKLSSVTKPIKGHLKGAIKKSKKAPRFLAEVELEEVDDLKVGDEISLMDIFVKGNTITVTGTSKGKGFAGVVKRYNFSGLPATHGHSGLRIPGSIGQGTTPGRVWKGKKMPGRMGGDTITVLGLTIVAIDSEKGEILISGSVPGSLGSLLVIKRTSPKQEVEEVSESEEKEENAKS